MTEAQERSDAQLLADIRRTSKSIRGAIAKTDAWATERNAKVATLIDRGYSLRSVARDTGVSVQALSVGVKRARAKAA